MRTPQLSAVLLLIVGAVSVADGHARLPGRWWQLLAGAIAVALGAWRLARPRAGDAPAA